MLVMIMIRIERQGRYYGDNEENGNVKTIITTVIMILTVMM